MAKFKLNKPCFFDNRLYQAGDVVDFGDAPAPRGSVAVSALVEKAKEKVKGKASEPAAVAAEDAMLKGEKK